MKAIGHRLAIEVMKIAEGQGCRFRWESDSKRLLLETRHDPKGCVAGAIAAAEAIETETCGECRGPGRRRRKTPRGRIRTRCEQCATPGEAPIETKWTAPEAATMTPAEAAPKRRMEPDSIVRLQCCRWKVNRVTDLMNHRFGSLDRDGAAIHARGGWNHLARALLRLVLGNGVWGAMEQKVRLATAVSGVSERPELAPSSRTSRPPDVAELHNAGRRGKPA